MDIEPIDVVVPVRSAEGSEYRKLILCTRAIRRRIPVKRLIIPTSNRSDKTRRIVSKLADVPIFDETAVGAGLCRNLGLREAESEYYASIDADTAVRKEWYPWCISTIKKPKVIACQGYSRAISKLLDRFVQAASLDVGTYADLGNTMLRTEWVRKIGMPATPMLEDHLLHDKAVGMGYHWIVNRELSSDHLLNELDVIRHRYWYGKFERRSPQDFAKYSLWITRETVVNRSKTYGWQLAFFLMLADLATGVGSIKGYYAAEPTIT